MKRTIMVPVLALSFLGCTKYEADIDALTGNKFDQEYQGPSFMEIDSITTRPVGSSGLIHQQRIYVSLDHELTALGDYEIRFVEITDPDTFYFTPSTSQYEVLNQQVQLGTEYCYKLDLSIGNAELTNHRVTACSIAEL